MEYDHLTVDNTMVREHLDEIVDLMLAIIVVYIHLHLTNILMLQFTDF